MSKTLTIVIILIIIIGGYILLRDTDRIEDRNGVQTEVPAPGTAQGDVQETIVEEESEPEPEPQTEFKLRKINISGNEFSFDPSSLILQRGERAEITFENTGNLPHNLTIEGTEIATKTIAGGKSDTIEFIALSSGTYTIFCSVPGHREAGMVGEFMVED